MNFKSREFLLPISCFQMLHFDLIQRRSARVLTQHGLSGLPGAQGRIGTSTGTRQIKDARYWQSQLQIKMDEIRRETERLIREKQTMDREKSAKKTFDKRAKEANRELTVLQAKLSDMNIALDSANSNITRQQMNQETTVLRERNEEFQQQLEKTFNEKQAKEAINEKLEKEIELERNKINKVIEAMSEPDQEKYRKLDALAQQLSEQNNAMHEEINMMINKRDNLETIAKSSNERAEAVRLLLKLNELEMKLMQLKEEEQRRLTPAQEREKLIGEVRENKQALNGIQHQIKLAEDALHEKRELLQQIDDDLDEGNSERYAKYKELKHRDETMSKFMDNFKENLQAEMNKIEMIKSQITSAIEQITMNGVNLKTLGLSKAALDDGNDLTSEHGMLKEYKRLLVILKQLQILKKRTADQIDTIQKEELQLQQEIEKFSNLSALRNESAERYDETSSRLEDLKHKQRVTENVVEEAQQRNEEIKEQLKSNDNYRQISHLEERLSDLIDETKEATTTFDEMQKEYNHDDIINDAKEKLQQIAEILRSNTPTTMKI
ncbi:putative leucine-rich repeat-containing protein DDB_G0290503 isoform X2 [Contarinia nasturtii]|uniref:putative leucine-rich repeat-containing protein DDB_G0290503 isoform X2 n=1 Tax=Contarinia nasturtii TaxID=265458 RepID=UPI0012D47906|nr:putative leucine-rich repeat-containing protein DDB_G0290503 isoform X2 [Contarinia nasturtii]